jgi:uncharacterized protein (TIGR03083 family)
VDTAALLRTANDDARALLTAAQTGWDRRVPHCPDWDAAGLVRHTGGIFAWMSAIITARDRVDKRSLDPAPASLEELPPWYLSNLSQTLDAIGDADPDSDTWTFSSTGDRRVAWWARRLAVEVAIHRWDAQHAATTGLRSTPSPIDADVADAGIEEFIVEFLPGLLSQDTVDPPTGTLHLHATDGPTEWWIDLDSNGATLQQQGEGDTAIRGTRSDLLLWLTNRHPLDTTEHLGSQQIPEHWGQLRR